MGKAKVRWYILADESKQYYSCYTPEWFYEKLTPSENTFMFYLFKKMRLNRKIENIEFHMDDVKNLSRMSFFNAMKSLKEGSYLKISKLDKSTYAISLNKESGHYTEQDYEHLTRPFMSRLPEMTMKTAAQSAPQVKQLPVSKICESGNHSDCMSANRPGTCGCECHKNKISSYM